MQKCLYFHRCLQETSRVPQLTASTVRLSFHERKNFVYENFYVRELFAMPLLLYSRTIPRHVQLKATHTPGNYGGIHKRGTL